MFLLHHRRLSPFVGGILLLLVGSLTFVLASCGGQASSSTQTSSTPAPAATTAAAPTAPPAATTTPAKVMQVKIVENNGVYSFQPATISIPKGTEVVWTNASDAPHTVSSDTNVFNTPSDLNENQTFKMVFNTTGTFAYHCNVHPYMKAKIVVTS